MSRILVLLMAAGLMVAGRPAFAERLVLRDGNHLETRGPWRVEGPQVIFTRSNGLLASIRLSEVDLAASYAPQVDAEAPGTPAPPPPHRPVMVLTNDDVRKATPAVHGTGAPSEPASRIEVADWAEIEKPGLSGLWIVGVLRNRGSSPARVQWVEVELNDRTSGELIERKRIFPRESLLGPHESTTFRVRFARAPNRGRPTFRVGNADTSHPLATVIGSIE